MSSPLVTQFRRGGVSKDVRMTAATGALPLSPADQIELLFLLTRDSDDGVSAQASTSLEAMDEASLISVLKEVSTPRGRSRVFRNTECVGRCAAIVVAKHDDNRPNNPRHGADPHRIESGIRRRQSNVTAPTSAPHQGARRKRQSELRPASAHRRAQARFQARSARS